MVAVRELIRPGAEQSSVDCLRLFQRREMTAVADHLQLRSGRDRSDFFGQGARRELVLFPDQHQKGQLMPRSTGRESARLMSARCW